MKIALYCICGAAGTGSGDPCTVAKIRDIFWGVHSGPGHEACDAVMARNARRRAEDVEERRRKLDGEND